MKYAIRLKHTGEFLRTVFEKEDAYTDNLGWAQIFDNEADAKMLCNPDEEVVLLGEDENGDIAIQPTK